MQCYMLFTKLWFNFCFDNEKLCVCITVTLLQEECLFPGIYSLLKTGAIATEAQVSETRFVAVPKCCEIHLLLLPGKINKRHFSGTLSTGSSNTQLTLLKDPFCQTLEYCTLHDFFMTMFSFFLKAQKVEIELYLICEVLQKTQRNRRLGNFQKNCKLREFERPWARIGLHCGNPALCSTLYILLIFGAYCDSSGLLKSPSNFQKTVLSLSLECHGIHNPT